MNNILLAGVALGVVLLCGALTWARKTRLSNQKRPLIEQLEGLLKNAKALDEAIGWERKYLIREFTCLLHEVRGAHSICSLNSAVTYSETITYMAGRLEQLEERSDCRAEASGRFRPVQVPVKAHSEDAAGDNNVVTESEVVGAADTSLVPV